MYGSRQSTPNPHNPNESHPNRTLLPFCLCCFRAWRRRSLVGIDFRNRRFGAFDLLGDPRIQKPGNADSLEFAELAFPWIDRNRGAPAGISLDSKSISHSSGIASIWLLFHRFFSVSAGFPRTSRSCETDLVPDFLGILGGVARNHSAFHLGGHDLLGPPPSAERRRLRAVCEPESFRRVCRTGRTGWIRDARFSR